MEKNKKKYIATRFAFLSYGLFVGVLSIGTDNFLFPILATIIGYIMTSKWFNKIMTDNGDVVYTTDESEDKK